MSVIMQQLSNPYWDEIKHAVKMDEFWHNLRVQWLGIYGKERLDRDTFCRKYTWAVPDPETVAFVARWLAPHAVEMGAGNGYWAWLMAQCNVNVMAYDEKPPDRASDNPYHSPRKEQKLLDDEDTLTGQLIDTFHPVKVGTPLDLTQHTDRTLFLCWPPYANTMAKECLQHYHGSRLVYIGEGNGGCTGDDDFHKRLYEEWEEIASHTPVQWDGIRDYVMVYERITEIS